MAGCTAVAALVSEGVLTVANAGDSRCVACRAGRAIAMTVDHKPNDEAEHDRILKVGSWFRMENVFIGCLAEVRNFFLGARE